MILLKENSKYLGKNRSRQLTFFYAAVVCGVAVILSGCDGPPPERIVIVNKPQWSSTERIPIGKDSCILLAVARTGDYRGNGERWIYCDGNNDGIWRFEGVLEGTIKVRDGDVLRGKNNS